MKSDHPAALKSLAKLGAGHSVIYFQGEAVPYPVTTAGEFRSRPFFMLGSKGHWIDSQLDAEVTAGAIAYRKGGELLLYVTTAENAPEVRTGLVVDAITTMREAIGRGAGLAEAIRAMDPLGELE